jgi:hypothetical protein
MDQDAQLHVLQQLLGGLVGLFDDRQHVLVLQIPHETGGCGRYEFGFATAVAVLVISDRKAKVSILESNKMEKDCEVLKAMQVTVNIKKACLSNEN